MAAPAQGALHLHHWFHMVHNAAGGGTSPLLHADRTGVRSQAWGEAGHRYTYRGGRSSSPEPAAAANSDTDLSRHSSARPDAENNARFDDDSASPVKLRPL
ncbi:hypothetical protein NDU88_006540 [Pleurodeles waltl]|uniref:Uncharacterized protein n=1 Tax=Pleurodeles waltl TaxID=8319 RepID=A0AAV7X0I7_PLEWA|nr:hypothetical protein NDU88_006540 [Pleurodeles waltl]